MSTIGFCKVPQSIRPPYLACRITEKCKSWHFHSISGCIHSNFSLASSAQWSSDWISQYLWFPVDGIKEEGSCLVNTPDMTSLKWQVLLIILLQCWIIQFLRPHSVLPVGLTRAIAVFVCDDSSRDTSQAGSGVTLASGRSLQSKCSVSCLVELCTPPETVLLIKRKIKSKTV